MQINIIFNNISLYLLLNILRMSLQVYSYHSHTLGLDTLQREPHLHLIASGSQQAASQPGTWSSVSFSNEETHGPQGSYFTTD